MPIFPRALLTIFVIAAVAVSSPRAFAQTYLVDTGPATATTGGLGLFASGSTPNCSPQPSCTQSYQWLAAQFTLTEAATIDAIEVWLQSVRGGSIRVNIRTDVNGLPGTDSPRLLRVGSLFSNTYQVASQGPAGWVAFGGYGAVLPAGTYWITLEPVANGGFDAAVRGGTAAPLAKYAVWHNFVERWGPLSGSAPTQFGIRIRGAAFPGVAFGTATRYLQDGEVFDCCRYLKDRIVGGEGRPLTRSGIIVAPGGGTTIGKAKLPEATANTPPSLEAGAYSNTSSAVGGARGVAYRTFRNVSTVPKTVRVNAVLDGDSSGFGGNASAGVYALSPQGFAAAVNASGLGAAEFLVGRDDLSFLRSRGNALTLATLFPSNVVLTSRFVHLPTVQGGAIVPIQLSTDLITVQPDQAVTLMFDVAVYSRGEGRVDFLHTLKPAANLFTDANGNPVPEVVAVGTSAAEAAPATAITLTTDNPTSGVGTLATLTARATTATGAPAADTEVTFSIVSGPMVGLVEMVTTDSDGVATLSYGSNLTGTDRIVAATDALQSEEIEQTWHGGALARLSIAPIGAVVGPGQSQIFTAQGFDTLDNSLGDVTATTLFSIAPAGTCIGAACSAPAPGAYVVTATNAGHTAAATLTVSAPACAADVSAQVTVTHSGYRLNRGTNTFSQTVTVANFGAALTDAVLVLDGLGPNATLQSPGGMTSCSQPAGSPFVVLPALGANQAATVVLQFSDPSRGAIAYQVRVLLVPARAEESSS